MLFHWRDVRFACVSPFGRGAFTNGAPADVGAEFRNPGRRSVGLRNRVIIRPSARTKGGTGRSSIRSRSEHRNRYYEPSHGAPAHWAWPAVERTGRCLTEAR